jgi:hypothetical protein
MKDCCSLTSQVLFQGLQENFPESFGKISQIPGTKTPGFLPFYRHLIIISTETKKEL